MSISRELIWQNLNIGGFDASDLRAAIRWLARDCRRKGVRREPGPVGLDPLAFRPQLPCP